MSLIYCRILTIKDKVSLWSHTIKAAERGNRIIYLADGMISDEIDLGPYAGDYKDTDNPKIEEAVERHNRLKGFLQKMGW